MTENEFTYKTKTTRHLRFNAGEVTMIIEVDDRSLSQSDRDFVNGLENLMADWSFRKVDDYIPEEQ